MNARRSERMFAHCCGWMAVGTLCIGAAPCSAQHLWYNDVSTADMVINRVQATAVAPNTYFEVLGWNPGGEAGGYTGIQFGTARNMIFSIWDPSNGQAIAAVYKEPGSRSNRFGGEGTGLHWDNTPIGDTWQLGVAYTFVCRAWPVQAGMSTHTQFGLWTWEEATGRWTHHVTMDFPMADQGFAFGLNSFLELWAGYDPAFRYVEFSGGWARTLAAGWRQLRTGGTDGGLTNPPPATQAMGGVNGSSFFLRSGAGFASNASIAVSVPVLASPPAPPVVRIVSVRSRLDAVSDTLSLGWECDPLTAPQFWYRIEVYGNASGTGTPVLTSEASAPHVRSITLPRAQFPPGTYSARIRVRDIFDREAVPLFATFTTRDLHAVYLSDLAWSSATNGWGPVERDRSNGEAGASDGHTLSLEGRTYAKGIGCHAESAVTLLLPPSTYRSFAADVGVDDEVGDSGSVEFKVYFDGQLRFQSGLLLGTSASRSVDLDVRGVRELRLVVTNADGDATADHADWAGGAFTPLVCPADFDDSGAVSIQDLFDFLSAYFATAPAADVNGANGVTVQDIFDFLAAYFAGCP